MPKWEFCYLHHDSIFLMQREGFYKKWKTIPIGRNFIEDVMKLASNLSKDGWELIAIDSHSDFAAFKRSDDGEEQQLNINRIDWMALSGNGQSVAREIPKCYRSFANKNEKKLVILLFHTKDNE